MGNRRRHSIVRLIVFTVLIPSAFAGKPRLARLQFPTRDLVPVISFDVTAPPYSADRTGRRDCTKAFAAALADASREGGTVFAPAGRYRIDGVLTIPPGVALRGDRKRVTRTQTKVAGTILLARAGRGNADGAAFISVDKGGVRDVSIFYPEQKADNIQPYPYAINLVGDAAMENVTLVNAYRGVLTGSFSTVMNFYGTTLDCGLTMLKAVAVPRCRNVRLSPRYWCESGLEGAPEYSRLHAILTKRKAYGIGLNRQDGGIFINIEIDGYQTGVRFMPPHGWTYWHNIHIRNAEIGIHFTGGSAHSASMTGCSIAASRYAILMKMDKTGWDPKWSKLSKSGKPFGTRRDSATARMFGCRFEGGDSCIYLDGSFSQKVNLQECAFDKWSTAAINANGGEIVVFDGHFEQARSHVKVNGKPKAVQIIGNTFAGSPDIKLPRGVDAKLDHTVVVKDSSRSIRTVIPPPDPLPAHQDALYVVSAPADGSRDTSATIQAALDQAGKNGGGTVYLPQGLYRAGRHLTVPAGVELRGANDFMPRGKQVRTLLIADLPGDRGKPGNPPFITLQSAADRGGSGVAGLGLWYPHQDYRNVQPYPWTIRGIGPGCWVQRVYLGNCYNAVDFASHNSDKHVLSRVCGSALNIGFMVGKCPTIGWIDNCHIRPQDWALAAAAKPKPKRRKKRGTPQPVSWSIEYPGDRYSKPTTQDIFRGTKYSLIPNMRGAGAITIGSGANEQVTAYFTNGATRAIDFVDHDGSGGGNANVLIGGSEAGWGAWIKALGDKGLTMVNFSINPMSRLPYVKPADIPKGNLPKGMAIRIAPEVGRKPINLIMTRFSGRKEIDVGIEMGGGDVFFKQSQGSTYRRTFLEKKGGVLHHRNTEME